VPIAIAYDGIWLSAVEGGKSGVRSSSLGIKPHVVSSEPELASIDLTKNDAVADTEANCGIDFDPNAAATQLNSTSSVTKTAAAAAFCSLSFQTVTFAHLTAARCWQATSANYGPLCTNETQPVNVNESLARHCKEDGGKRECCTY
jgi:hypothetical protein